MFDNLSPKIFDYLSLNDQPISIINRKLIMIIITMKKYPALLQGYLQDARAAIFFINVNEESEIDYLQKIIDKTSKYNYLKYLVTTHTNLYWKISQKEIIDFAIKNELYIP